MNAYANGRILMFTVLALIAMMVSANQCSDTCGSIAARPAVRIRSCPVSGLSRNHTQRIDWSDGSFSDYTVSLMTQLVTGSCCSRISYAQYAIGIVTDGRFSGQPITYVDTLRDDRTNCNNGCQTNSDLSRVTGPILLSIGTKGVGQWIECSGTHTVLFTPGLTSNPQLVTGIDFADLSDCSTCVESC